MTTPPSPLLCKSLIALLLAIALTPAARAEETLGRLFFTPERRQALDRQRQLNIQDSKQVVEDPTLTINGMVTRSSGKRTSWINGAAQNENEMSGGTVIIPRKKERGVVEVQGGDLPAATARIGETVNRNTGEARDLLNDGRIVIKPSAAK
jgi:hypothetical protein